MSGISDFHFALRYMHKRRIVTFQLQLLKEVGPNIRILNKI